MLTTKFLADTTKRIRSELISLWKQARAEANQVSCNTEFDHDSFMKGVQWGYIRGAQDVLSVEKPTDLH